MVAAATYRGKTIAKSQECRRVTLNRAYTVVITLGVLCVGSPPIVFHSLYVEAKGG